MPVAPKYLPGHFDDIFLIRASCRRTLETEMLFRADPSIVLLIFYEIMLALKVTPRILAQEVSRHEWVSY